MNDTIQLMKEHRSYRNFDENYALPEEDLQEILDAARQAPSWMNGQAYDIIVIKDKEIRQQLVDWNPGNPHMLKSSVFLLFVGNLERFKMVCDHHEAEYHVGESLDHILVATTDASMAMQNAILAAESLGLGSVPVGSVRKHITEIAELLNLPQYTFPLCGVSIGKPIVEMKIKPRLPQACVVHQDTYKPYVYDLIEGYDKIMKDFAEARETKLWSVKFADYYGGAYNQKVNDYFKKHGLLKKIK